MKTLSTIILLILVIQTAKSQSWGEDTLYYDNGNIKSIYIKNKFSKIFYKNGNLKEYVKFSSYWIKSLEITYDTLGQITSKGKFIFKHRSHGTYKYYENNVLIEEEKFKYGVEVEDLKNKNGKIPHCYLGFGYVAFPLQGPCKEAHEKYNIRFITVANGATKSAIIKKVNRHNFWVNLIMNIKHGKNWREDIYTMCNNK